MAFGLGVGSGGLWVEAFGLEDSDLEGSADCDWGPGFRVLGFGLRDLHAPLATQ